MKDGGEDGWERIGYMAAVEVCLFNGNRGEHMQKLHERWYLVIVPDGCEIGSDGLNKRE